MPCTIKITSSKAGTFEYGRIYIRAAKTDLDFVKQKAAVTCAGDLATKWRSCLTKICCGGPVYDLLLG